MSAALQARPRADSLVSQHAELVKRIAYHLVARLPASVDVDDLIQAGMIALLECADGYRDDKGASFETFAGIRIRGAMLDELRKLDWAPRSVHRNARRIAAAIRECETESGEAARDEDVASKLGIGIAEYHAMLADVQGAQLLSLDDTPGDDDRVHEVRDESASPAERIADESFRGALAETIGGLPERERLVMSLYYDEELNLKEIGAVIGVSESRVSQLHSQALARIRARMADWL